MNSPRPSSERVASDPGIARQCRRWFAVCEVVLAFAVTHIAIKALKQLTPLGEYEREAGLNLTPAVVMAVAAAVILVRRTTQHDCAVAAGWSPISLRHRWTLAAAYLIPLVLMLTRATDTLKALAVFCGHIFVTAVGEELFFRGYVQPRLNEAFGRPWRWRHVAVGWGVVVAAILFGVLHGLNTVDYFHGRFDFAWRWAGGTLVTGLVFGWLRDRSESVTVPIVAHGLWNVWLLSLILSVR